MMFQDEGALLDLLDFWSERPGVSYEPHIPAAGEHGQPLKGTLSPANGRGGEPTAGIYLHFTSRKEIYAASQDQAR